MKRHPEGTKQNKGGKMSTTGEKPGKGTYHCTAPVCRRVVILDNDKDTLPPCPTCGNTDFTAEESKEKLSDTLRAQE